jgi:glycosyltransferase involved in cell wall biosynthesis
VRRVYEHPVENRPLRVVLVLWGGYIGGAESFTADLARALIARGAEASVLFILDGRALGERFDREGIPHSALGLSRGRRILRAPRRFARTVTGIGADVAVLVEAGWFPAVLRLGGYRRPIVGVEHGSSLQLSRHSILERLFRAAALKAGMNACSAVVGVSKYMAGRISGGRRSRRVVCIPNGVDLERFRPGNGVARRSEEVILGCAGRLVEGKGFEDVLEAIADRRLDRVRLRIAGEGDRLQALQALARSLAVDSRTEFVGAVPDMPSFWRGTDVVVAPSREVVESFGMSAVEAMACGKPVVATDNGGLAEVVADGETGRIVPPGDVTALASALGEYVEDADRRTAHGTAGRRRCELNYDIDRTASQYLALCSELISAEGWR